MNQQIEHLNRILLGSQMIASQGFPDFLTPFLREGTALEWLIQVN